MRLLTRRQAFGVAAVIALVVAGLVYVVLSQQARVPEPVVPQTTTVVVATQDIPAFTPITGAMVTTKTMNVDAAPVGALGNVQQAIGQLAQSDLVADQTITQADIAPRTASHGLTFVIPQGLRAVTVALDAISGVGGFVFPGDHVDVLATFKEGEVTLTRTILQNVEVLAMNELTTRPVTTRQQAGPADQGAQTGQGEQAEAPAAEAVRSATLAVTPDQAEALILSAVEGTVHMVLRPREDSNIVSLAGQTDYGLMGVPPPAKQGAQPAEGTAATGPMPMMTPMGWPTGMSQPPMVSGGGAAGGGAAASGGGGGRAAGPAPHTVEVIRGGEREVVTP